MFGKRLKALRLSKDLTQKQLGSYLHVSDGTVAMWETGKRLPDITMLIKISDFFAVSVDYLLGHETTNVKQNAIDEAIRLMELATQKLKDNVQE